MTPDQVTDKMKQGQSKFIAMPNYMKENPDEKSDISQGSFISDMSNLTEKEKQLELEKQELLEYQKILNEKKEIDAFNKLVSRAAAARRY